jgi:cytochrome c peroxidase
MLKMDSAIETFLFASCHPVAAGFYSGNLQGNGEGGKGFNRCYGHGGIFISLNEVVSYIVKGEKQNNSVPNTQLVEDFTDRNLKQQEINDSVAFIENALYDSNLERYVPTQVFSGNCIPNGDLQSQIDLECN